MLVVEAAVHGYFFLEHVHAAASKLAQVDHLDRHSHMGPQDLNSLEDATAVSLAQLFRSVVFVTPHAHLCLPKTCCGQLIATERPWKRLAR